MAIPRSKCLSTKVTPDDYALFEALAAPHSVSAWARDALLHVARRPAAEQILLEEILALRTILLNLQFAVAAGTPPTAEDMHRLIHRADADKAQKALERLPAAIVRRPR
jgi:predicted RNA-binding Zn ribbon-like protein